MAPRVSVIFVNYNSHDLLQRAVATLRRTHPPDSVEILVVDNGSTPPPSPAFPPQWQVRWLRLPRNVGYGQAVNLAARFAHGEYLVAANPDLEFRDHEVDAMAHYLDQHPEVGAVVPQYLNPTPHGLQKQPSARRFHRLPYLLFGRISPLSRLWPENRFTREFLALETLQARDPVDIEVGVGAFLMVRRRLFEQLGGFDPRFFLFSEDSDLCARIWQAGFRVRLLPQVQLLHHHGAVRRRARARPRYWRMKAVLLFLKKHRSPSRPLQFLLHLGFALTLALYLFLEALEVVFQ